jgi:glycosyltransferase involved in cell wall biosynthesis
MKKKVLFLLPSICGGGAERVIVTLINSINHSEFYTILVVINKSDISNEYKVSPDKLIRLEEQRVIFSARKISNIIINEKPDIIFSTLTYLNCYIGGLLFFLNTKSKIIFRESTLPTLNHKKYFLPFLYDFLVKITYTKADIVVCQSKDMVVDLLSIAEVQNKVIIIPNPIDFHETSKSNYKIDLENFQGLVFLTVAMLRSEKGINRLLGVLSKMEIPFRYYIIGEGPERNTLQLLVEELKLSDRVFFMGYSKTPWEIVNPDLVTAYLQGSYYEGFPNVLLEAGIRGIPLLANKCSGGTSEIINNGVNGFLFTDFESFNSSITSIKNGYINREVVKLDIEKRFSLTSIVAQYENLFNDLITK